MASFVEDLKKELQCSRCTVKSSASWQCRDCDDTLLLCDRCEGWHSLLYSHRVRHLADLTSEDIERIRARVNAANQDRQNGSNDQTDFTAGHTRGTIEVKSETEALKTERLIVTTRSGELNQMHVQFRPEGNVTIVNRYERTDGKVGTIEFMAKVPGQLTAEVQVNEIDASTSRPLVVNVRPQKMRITGQFNMEGVNIGSSEIRDIAVNRDNSRIAVSAIKYSSLNWGTIVRRGITAKIDRSRGPNEFPYGVFVFNIDGNLLCSCDIESDEHNSPQGLAFLNDKDLVIADRGYHRMCIVNTTTGALVKPFGNQGNGDGQFRFPCGVHVDDDGNIIVCDGGNHRVQVFTRDGDYQYQFGLRTQDVFFLGDVITHKRLFYVSDDNNHIIQVFKKIHNVPTRISTIGGQGIADGQLVGPWGLAIDNDYHLLVCDNGNNSVQKFTLDGRFVGQTCDVIKKPEYITVLRDGQLLVSTGMTDDEIDNPTGTIEDDQLAVSTGMADDEIDIPTDTTEAGDDSLYMNIYNPRNGRLSVRGGSGLLFVK
ncbi:uncharacterized protein LOC116289950 [Actinia tenebrosa]|uniref:Uncharacterized protein LOC116289950 n=1 Tax=Actinia tenebrosa TaxID=6105 RepID=A0A6P8HJJ2_ACTTE|nr:uncharacterized protein LOC116289950 [Actinia tenebrosa]